MTIDPDLIVDLVSRDRKFLHDLASPLMIAQGGVERLLSENEIASPEQKPRIESVQRSLERIGDLLSSQREFILEISKKLGIDGKSSTQGHS